MTLRVCGGRDQLALRRIAERDSAVTPAGTVLGAEVAGELRAAICLATGAVVADPFFPTAELVELLRTRAGQLRGERDRGRRLRALGHSDRPAGGDHRQRSLDRALPSPGS